MNLAKLIDHTLLKPDATLVEITQLCKEAIEQGFYAVCINSYWIPNARLLLQKSPVKIAVVVGFPFGATLPQVKAYETTAAVAAGADEIDMVMNLGAAREGHWEFIEHEIHSVVSAAHGRPVKVILETTSLTEAQIREACHRAVKGGAQFVKTSTGFGIGGATVEAVQWMRETVGPSFGVKASGGIRTKAIAQALVAAGANRLGCSSSLLVVRGESASMEERY